MPRRSSSIPVTGTSAIDCLSETMDISRSDSASTGTFCPTVCPTVGSQPLWVITEQLSSPKDRSFQSFRVPRSDTAKSVVAGVVNQIQNYEKHFGLRKRARRKVDQEIFAATIAAVICDAIHRFCEDPDGKIAVTRSHTLLGHKSRYRSPALETTLPKLLDRLRAPEMDFIKMDMGGRSEEMIEGGIMRTVGKQTTIQAAPALIRRINDNNLWFSDLDTSETEEIIILKAEKARGEAGEWLDYEDTQDTLRYRSDLRSVNEWLTQADIEFYEQSDATVECSAWLQSPAPSCRRAAPQAPQWL